MASFSAARFSASVTGSGGVFRASSRARNNSSFSALGASCPLNRYSLRCCSSRTRSSTCCIMPMKHPSHSIRTSCLSDRRRSRRHSTSSAACAPLERSRPPAPPWTSTYECSMSLLTGRLCVLREAICICSMHRRHSAYRSRLATAGIVWLEGTDSRYNWRAVTTPSSCRNPVREKIHGRRLEQSGINRSCGLVVQTVSRLSLSVFSRRPMRFHNQLC